MRGIPLFVLLWSLYLPGMAYSQVQVLVAYYSETGNTEKMAQGVAAGAGRVKGAQVVLKKVGAVTREDLLGADAVIVGSPVHLGDVAFEVRRAMVAWSSKYGFYRGKQLQDKVGAVFATGGAPSNGKEFTMLSMAYTLLQFGMVLVGPYGTIGASATTTTPPCEKGVGERELDEARSLGERAATIAQRMKKGA